MIDIRIVITTLNSENLLQKCLESIKKSIRNYSYEIFVVDNNSSDNTISMVKKEFPEVVLIENDKNEGVARGRNRGLVGLNAKFALLLDADTEIKNGSLDSLIKFANKNSQIGICGAKLVSPEGELQLTCRNFHNILIPFFRRLTFLKSVRRSKILNDFLMTDYDHENPKKVDQVIGACQLIRREVFTKIGLLDKKMFYGWEDTDYCVRAMKAGFETWYFPKATIVHHEQRITKRKIFSRLFFENLKSMFIFFTKYPSGIVGKY